MYISIYIHTNNSKISGFFTSSSPRRSWVKIKSFIPSPQPTEKRRHWLDSMFKSQETYLTATSRRVESRPPPMHFYKYLSSLSLCLQALLYLLCQPVSICLPMSHLSRYQLPIATCLPTNLCARKFPQIEPPSSISRSSSSSASKSESPSSSWWSHFDSFSAVLWCKIKVNMHLFHLAKGFPILDFKDVQSMDLVQQMEVWEVQNYL